MKKRPRRNHTAAFKAKVALAAIKGDRTIAQLADQIDAHASQITTGGKRGKQVAPVVGHHLNGVLAGLECQRLRHSFLRPCAWGAAQNSDRDAVNTPFDAPDPSTTVGETSFCGDNRNSAIRRRRNGE
jgi:hypothetical protein